ncbi:MAG: hypothetical protein P4L71_18505, partial [Acetobacteraceae bacterium]|nr:hypothetical protein [Acetobacteraceae bacterium]
MLTDQPPAARPSDASPAARRLGRVATGLQTSGGTAEHKFLAIGQALERAVAIHATLAAAFDTLLAEMHGSAVSEARAKLATAATAAAALAEAPLADGAALEQMVRLAGAIGGSMTALKRIVGDIDVLAMNARLTAAGMGGVGGDFLDFAGAIRRSAQLAEARLGEVNHELTALHGHLTAARTDIAAFAAGHQAALRGVPARLTAAIGALSTQDRLAAAATAAVGRR